MNCQRDKKKKTRLGKQNFSRLSLYLFRPGVRTGILVSYLPIYLGLVPNVLFASSWYRISTTLAWYRTLYLLEPGIVSLIYLNLVQLVSLYILNLSEIGTT
jgi:hypothetical protein